MNALDKGIKWFLQVPYPGLMNYNRFEVLLNRHRSPNAMYVLLIRFDKCIMIGPHKLILGLYSLVSFEMIKNDSL